MGFGIGQPTERELTLLWNVRLFESLIPFAELFEEPMRRKPWEIIGPKNFEKELKRRCGNSAPPVKKKPDKPEFDWRVVVASAKGGLRCPQLARNRP